MIARISGALAGEEAGAVIVDVGGVGLRVFVTPDTAAALAARADGRAMLETYLAVRENALDLYGFADPRDRRLFELLIGVPGIGPKSALAVLSLAPSETLAASIRAGDTTHLTSVSGVGRKTAEKIILELKDKLGKETGGADARHGDIEVLEALRALGYPLADARRATQSLDPALESVNERIKAALRFLSNGRSI